MERFQNYIDGRFEEAVTSFVSLNPATGKGWAQMPLATAEDVGRAVAAAERAFYAGSWAGLSASARGKLLMRLADGVQESAADLAALETRDTGKIIRETSAQISYVADFYRYYGGLADKIEGVHLPVDKPDMEVWLRREPVGVVGAIVPWNSQLFLSAVKLGPALAAGCTVVLKASEDGPAPLLALAKLVAQAGFPPGVVNILAGGVEAGQALVAHPKIAHIAFTGGPETARRVVRGSAENLAKISLELGGKSPFIVFEDADLDSAVNAQIAGIFAATGQSCVAGSRLLVRRSIKEVFLTRLIDRLRGLRIGAPDDPDTEFGPLCTQRQRDRIGALVTQSCAAGARLIIGGAPLERAGFYYPPTILDCSHAADAPCVDQEMFGPVLTVQSFETEEEALGLANASRYGLAAGLFTRDLTRAHRMIRSLRSGIVWVNSYRAVSPIVPFGGCGLSGYGREGGMAAALDYTMLKSVWVRTSDEPISDPFVMR